MTEEARMPLNVLKRTGWRLAPRNVSRVEAEAPWRRGCESGSSVRRSEVKAQLLWVWLSGFGHAA